MLLGVGWGRSGRCSRENGSFLHWWRLGHPGNILLASEFRSGVRGGERVRSGGDDRDGQRLHDSTGPLM